MIQLPSGFKLICRIQPDINSSGRIEEYYPHREYKNIDNKDLLPYGTGPFCKFRIPTANANKMGVYMLIVNDSVKYVGECEDLARRFNVGYGQISPRNCFVGGQATNCRINSFIYQSYVRGQEVYLHFVESNNRFVLEEELIDKFSPEWNRQGGKQFKTSPKIKEGYLSNSNLNSNHRTTSNRDKYLPLNQYLVKSQKSMEILTFEQVESILGTVLPKSAYTYDAWWANGGHKHANSWMDAGWEVDDYVFGKYVKFVKK